MRAPPQVLLADTPQRARAVGILREYDKLALAGAAEGADDRTPYRKKSKRKTPAPTKVRGFDEH
jgi:hypothetical protein